MLGKREREEMARLWERKRQQDASKMPYAERHRNLEPASAEFICSLAAGIRAKRMVEFGGSSGISTIALATAAREAAGHLVSIEIEPVRQAEARETLANLNLARYVDFKLGDAASILPNLGEIEFALIDCNKDDYIRFFDLLQIHSGGVVVADNITSHKLEEYVAHVRSRPGVESITLPVGQGLEVTRFKQANNPGQSRGQ